MAAERRRTLIYGAAALAFAAILIIGGALILRLAPHGTKPMPDAPASYDRTQLYADLDSAGFKFGDPAFIRIFKREQRLEVWMQGKSGKFEKFRDYAICHFSGQLGPKLAEGDKQSPEGFYRVGLK